MKKYTDQKSNLTQFPLWFVTGFTDGPPGSFGLSVSKDIKRTIGYIISPSGPLSLRERGLHPPALRQGGGRF